MWLFSGIQELVGNMKYLLFFFTFSVALSEPIIVWKRADGSVSYTAMNWTLRLQNEPMQAFLDRMRGLTEQSQFVGYSYQDMSALPSDDREEYFRGAWTTSDGSSVMIDRKRAEQVHRVRLKSRVMDAFRQGLIRNQDIDVSMDSIDSMDTTTKSYPTLNALKSAEPSAVSTLPR